jgi:hypothetical protein
VGEEFENGKARLEEETLMRLIIRPPSKKNSEEIGAGIMFLLR